MAASSLIWQISAPTTRRYIIIRHAEKTGLPGDRDLSSEGLARAQALQSLPETLGTIDAIIAARSVAKSARPVETVEPLAAILGLPIDIRWNTHDIDDLVSTVSGDSWLDGKQILICWRHDALQALAQALGAQDASPWPSALYDRIWLLTVSRGSVHLGALRQILTKNIIRLVPEP